MSGAVSVNWIGEGGGGALFTRIYCRLVSNVHKMCLCLWVCLCVRAGKGGGA